LLQVDSINWPLFVKSGSDSIVVGGTEVDKMKENKEEGKSKIGSILII
jgi:hypothetical protein